jgi:DNA ligase-1
VKEKDGTKFKIGSGLDDAQRKNPPKVGTVVTFKF